MTSSGSEAVYNGVTDWLYGSKIMRSEKAIWWSPEGRRIAFATFNDTEVDTIVYPKYGSFADPSNIFSELVKSKFPRAGRVNPSVTLWVLDLPSTYGAYSIHKVKPPSEIDGR